MFNFGGMEILVILVVALLVLGPDKLPKFMRTIGKAVGELRRASTEFQRTVNTELTEEARQAVPDSTAGSTLKEPVPDTIAPDQILPKTASPEETSPKEGRPKEATARRPLPRARRPRARKQGKTEAE